MTIKAADVAKYLLKLSSGEMTTMKLQKLVFYSQAYKLAWTGSPMFEEKIRAWTHGPVVYELFQQHKGKFLVSMDEIKGDDNLIQDKDKVIADVVYEAFGGLTGWELRERTHAENPWMEAFDESESRHNREITHEMMSSFYSVEE